MPNKTTAEFEKAQLFDLYRFDGSPKVYWPLLIERLTGALSARVGAILIPPGKDGVEWRMIAAHPMNSAVLREAERLEQLAGDALERGYAESEYGGDTMMRAQRLGTLEDAQVAVAIVVTEGDQNMDRAWLSAASHLPYAFRMHRTVDAAEGKVDRLAVGLEIGFALQRSENFQEATMMLCNELAARFHADRVSVGWAQDGYIKLKAVSHTDKLDTKTEVARRLSAVMEECLDQDNEILVPTTDEAIAIVREHEQFLKEEEPGSVLSVPLRYLDRPIGVVTLERVESPFSIAETESLRLVADQCADPLEHLRLRSLSFPKKIARGVHRGVGRFFNYEHVWLKLLVVLIPLVFLALALIPWEHRLRAPFVLETQAAAEITAPYPGFIQTVDAYVGETVKAGDVLATLDTSELLLQEAESIAERERHLREAQRYKSEARLADMQIEELRAEQASAKLRIVRYRLDQAKMIAPFDGIVVEGGLEERIAAPVNQADVMFRIVQLKDLYGQIRLDERDLPYVSDGAVGEMAFRSRPDEKFEFGIIDLEPVATIDDEGTTFALRGDVAGGQQEWWRPGMSGVAKIDAGQRSILWIMFHRTVEFLRLFFWV